MVKIKKVYARVIFYVTHRSAFSVCNKEFIKTRFPRKIAKRLRREVDSRFGTTLTGGVSKSNTSRPLIIMNLAQ